MLQNDSPSYLKVADNLYQGNGYSNCPTAPYYKDVLRTPTYPMLIAGTKIFMEDIRVIFFLQLLLDLFTLIIIYRIGTRLFTRKAGLMGGLLYAISIINVVMCAEVLAETSFVFLTVLSLYLVSEKQKYLLGGLALGLAVLCKPIGLYLVVLYALYILITNKGFKAMCLVFFPFMILVGGWMLRNQSITNSLTISSISSYNLFAYNANMVLSHKSGTPESILRDDRIKEVYKQTKGELGDYSGHYDYIDKFGSAGKEIIIENLGLYVFLHLKNSINCLIPGVHYVLELYGKTEGKRGTMDVLRKEGLISATKAYFDNRWWSLVVMIPWIFCWVTMLVTATLGGIKIMRRRKWELVVLLILPGLYFLFISGPAAEPRFGALIAPYFCLLGGYYLGGYDRVKT